MNNTQQTHYSSIQITMGVGTSKPHPVETKWFPDYKEKLPSLEGKTIAVTGTFRTTSFLVLKTGRFFLKFIDYSSLCFSMYY